MTFIPEQPETKPVVVTSQDNKALDTFHINQFSVSLDPNDEESTMIVVAWSRGYVENGSYVAVENDVSRFSGPDMLSATADLYDPIKEALWQLIANDGGIAGQIQ